MKKFQFIILFAVGLSAGVLGQQRAEYGEVCNINITCVSNNTLDPLKCSTDGVCMCEDGMFRDPNLNRCVSGHNKSCTIVAGDGKPMRTCTEFAECWPNANTLAEAIRKNGTCHCNPNTIPNPDAGYCTLKHGSTGCKQETDCDVLSSLTCRNGTCVCQDEEFQTFNGTSCIALAGGSCVAVPPFVKPDCGDNMKCDNNGTNPTNKCVCKDGYSPNPDKTCGKGFDQECIPDTNDCNPDFECLESNGTHKCICPTGQVPSTNETCRVISGGNCSVTLGPQCIDYAECKNGVCECTSGFTASPDKTKCLGLLGTSCDNVTSPCAETDFLRCAEDSRCTCKDGYDNDEPNKICKGWLNSQCTPGKNGNCVGNIVCRDAGTGNSTCQCPNKHKASSNLKECFALHGGSCNSTTKCSNDDFLTCDLQSNVCSCSDLTKYLHEDGSDRCVAKANQPCSGNEGECVTNSTCIATNSRVCSCISNHKPNDEGRCVLSGKANSIVASSALLALVMIMVFEKNY